jgi:plasmid stabilization system protein ParE
LNVTAGVHEIIPEGFYRAISRRFLFAIYYLVEREEIIVSAVLDSRREPESIKRQLR